MRDTAAWMMVGRAEAMSGAEAMAVRAKCIALAMGEGRMGGRPEGAGAGRFREQKSESADCFKQCSNQKCQ